MSPIALERQVTVQHPDRIECRVYYSGVDGDAVSEITDSHGSRFTLKAVYFWFAFGSVWHRAFSYVIATARVEGGAWQR